MTHPLLNIAITAARKAGTIITRAFDRLDTVKATQKSGFDFVTNVDKQAEYEIIQIIKKAYPTHAILAEESGEQAGEDYTWIIDPLDGTTNFIHGFPHFAVSIAIQYRNRIEHAVIYDPIRHELFTATRGEGAQLDERRIRVSRQPSLKASLVGTGFPFRNPELLQPYLAGFQKLSPLCAGIRRAGSAALDLAYVAAGRLDGFWEYNLKPWDIAAGALLIKEAGGIITDFNGADDYLTSGNVVAGTPQVLKELLQQLKQ